jgi:hypothetical protein
MRILRLRKKRSKRKDTSNKWISGKDPKSDKVDRLHIGLNCLSDNFYKKFFKDNNAIVRALMKLDLEKDEQYSRFYEQGMRVSQQLDGPYREHSMARYDEQLASVYESLVECAIKRKKEIESATLDSFLEQILSSSASSKDKESAEKMVKDLKKAEIKRPKRRISIDDIVAEILKNDYSELEEAFSEVPDPLKTMFLAVTTNYKLDNSQNWFEGEISDLVQFLKRIGLVNSRLYLSFLQSSMQKEEGDRNIYNNWTETVQSIEDFDSEQRNIFFRMLKKTQEKGVGSFYCSIIAEAAARLYKKHGTDETDRIINEGFELYPGSENARELMEYFVDQVNSQRKEKKQIRIFHGAQRPQSRLYKGITEEFKTFKSDPHFREIFLRLRYPPYFEDCQSALEAYTRKIREMQKLVQENVGQIKLRLTETDGARYEHLFESHTNAVYGEFENWGLSLQRNGRYENTGHMWVTVDSARFRSNLSVQASAQDSLKTLKEIRDELAELFDPIAAFGETLAGYKMLLNNLFESTFGPTGDLIREESERVKSVEDRYEQEAYFIRKGILSLSFVNSLLHRLEESLDMCTHHPGD